MKKIKVAMREQSIVQFFDDVARELGYSEKQIEIAEYDCRKILVSEDRFNFIRRYYGDAGAEAFGMSWVCYGPKTDETMIEEDVQVEDGFVKLKEV